MNRITFHIVVLLFTFVFGVAVAKIYFIWDVQFKVSGVGSIGMCEEGLGRGTFYKSYDNEKLAFFSARFPSVEAAQNCFQSTLQRAARTFEREVLFDETGEHIVGERVVVLYGDLTETDAEQSATIISLDGDRIFGIASTSLRHALIYEKQTRLY